MERTRIILARRQASDAPTPTPPPVLDDGLGGTIPCVRCRAPCDLRGNYYVCDACGYVGAAAA